MRVYVCKRAQMLMCVSVFLRLAQAFSKVGREYFGDGEFR